MVTRLMGTLNSVLQKVHIYGHEDAGRGLFTAICWTFYGNSLAVHVRSVMEIVKKAVASLGGKQPDLMRMEQMAIKTCSGVASPKHTDCCVHNDAN